MTEFAWASDDRDKRMIVELEALDRTNGASGARMDWRHRLALNSVAIAAERFASDLDFAAALPSRADDLRACARKVDELRTALAYLKPDNQVEAMKARYRAENDGSWPGFETILCRMFLDHKLGLHELTTHLARDRFEMLLGFAEHDLETGGANAGDRDDRSHPHRMSFIGRCMEVWAFYADTDFAALPRGADGPMARFIQAACDPVVECVEGRGLSEKTYQTAMCRLIDEARE